MLFNLESWLLNNMIPSCRVFHVALPFLQTLLAALSLDHRCTSVQVTYNCIQDTYNIARHIQHCKTISKTEQRKLSTSWTAKPWQLKNCCNRVQWVHMGPTACKWHQTSYKWKQWHQLQSSEMNITWTDIKMERRIQNCFNWQNLQTYEQLLQYVWTASARQLNGFWKQTG